MYDEERESLCTIPYLGDFQIVRLYLSHISVCFKCFFSVKIRELSIILTRARAEANHLKHKKNSDSLKNTVENFKTSKKYKYIF